MAYCSSDYCEQIPVKLNQNIIISGSEIAFHYIWSKTVTVLDFNVPTYRFKKHASTAIFDKEATIKTLVIGQPSLVSAWNGPTLEMEMKMHTMLPIVYHDITGPNVSW